MSHQYLDFQTRIRERGFRVTPQRQFILDAICEGGGHTTPEEVYQRVHAKAPAVNRATVYRTVDFLCELRLIVAMRIGDQTFYEIASQAPHHHLVCRSCGEVIALDHDTLKTLFAKIEREHRFTVDMDHLALFGVCRHCRHAKEPRAD